METFTPDSCPRTPKYVPFELVGTLDETNFRTELPFENTKHRYPWLCSLKSKNSDPKHHCAVTLLR